MPASIATKAVVMKALALLFVLLFSSLIMYGQSDQSETPAQSSSPTTTIAATATKHEHMAASKTLLDPYNPHGTETSEQREERNKLIAKEAEQIKALKAKQED